MDTLTGWWHHDIAGHAVSVWFGWAWTLSTLVLIVWIVLQRKAPVSTLAWIMSLSFMPVVGLFVYAWFGPQRVKRQRLKRWHRRAQAMSRHDVEVLRGDLPDPPVWALQHSRLIEATCGLPMSSAHEVRLLGSGAATLEALLAEVAAARHHIHLEYYIFEPDRTGRRLLAALTEAAQRGVAVRLLVDAVGSPALLRRRQRALLDAFRAAGGQFAVFHPTRIDRLRPLVNLRTHRKIVVIDGAVGFVGGINVTDDENEVLEPERAYRDTHLLLRGGVVRWLQYVFVEDWRYAGGDGSGDIALETLMPEQPPGHIAVQIAASGPDTDGESIHRATIDALDMARERVLLATPYFVPTEPAYTALTNAALRGVKVKLMVPEKSDSRIVSAAARSYFKELQDAGVAVFEYHGRMFHAKTLVVDDDYAMVGSANFDNRSFRLNFEVAAVVMHQPTNAELARMFETDLAHCRRVPRQRKSPPLQLLFEAVARLGSPLL